MLSFSQEESSTCVFPTPKNQHAINGFFLNQIRYSSVSDTARNAEQSLIRHFPMVKKKNNNPSLFFIDNVSSQIPPEGYSLLIENETISIRASDAGGFYNAVQTLAQLASADSEKSFYKIQNCLINDAPAFSLRGFMHDLGRNYQNLKVIEKELEKMSHYKINTFQFHVTDNPAWRLESRIYPQLNDPKNHKKGRDEGKFYTFKEVHDLIAYAKKRNIKIIPELDMPGHSAYFYPTFGTHMYTDSGMRILEHLLDEFCAEFSKEECPIIHIGTDEVHIPNPSIFIERMVKKVKSHDREVMIWSPGLKANNDVIHQIWRDNTPDLNKKDTKKAKVIDSFGGYLNGMNPELAARRHFNHQVCEVPQGDSMHLGAILCCWPDIRVGDKSKIASYNGIWPALLAFSESVWCGNKEYASPTITLSHKDSKFKAFEKKLYSHQKRFFNGYPFPYQEQCDLTWKINNSKETAGGTIVLISRSQNEGVFQKSNVGDSFYAKGLATLDKPQEVEFLIGFESPARSNRQYGGIPKLGEWDAFGSKILLNGKPVPPPVWKNPGSYKNLSPTWHTSANEIPIENEELTWVRKPIKLQLEKGLNIIEIYVIHGYSGQSVQFTFIPVKQIDGNYHRDSSIKIVADDKTKCK